MTKTKVLLQIEDSRDMTSKGNIVSWTDPKAESMHTKIYRHITSMILNS